MITRDKIKVTRQLYKAKELTVEDIATTISVSRKTVHRHLGDAGLIHRRQRPAHPPTNGTLGAVRFLWPPNTWGQPQDPDVVKQFCPQTSIPTRLT